MHLSPSNLIRLLPIFLIATAVVGNGLFALLNIVPSLGENQHLNTELAIAQTAQAQNHANNTDMDAVLFERQITTTGDALNNTASAFLTITQVDELMERLYMAANEAGVIITSLRSMASEVQQDTVYVEQLIQLQVEGPIINLMNFIISFPEASETVVQFSNVSIMKAPEGDILTLDLHLYLSQLTQDALVVERGEPLALIALVPTAPPLPDEAVTAAQSNEAIETPVFEQAHVTQVPSTRILASSTMLPPQNNVDATELEPCAETEPSIFDIGDQVIVDFNRKSALNVLTAPRRGEEDPEIIVQAYDNHRMTLLDGPVCGSWEGETLWYWYVSYAGVQGWVGESSGTNRWLCPIEDPECAA